MPAEPHCPNCSALQRKLDEADALGMSMLSFIGRRETSRDGSIPYAVRKSKETQSREATAVEKLLAGQLEAHEAWSQANFKCSLGGIPGQGVSIFPVEVNGPAHAKMLISMNRAQGKPVPWEEVERLMDETIAYIKALGEGKRPAWHEIAVKK
jgi:hypothetical protein